MESKLSDVTVTALPAIPFNTSNNKSSNQDSPSLPLPPQAQTKYAQLLSIIEEMGKEVRPSYSGSRSSAERLKRGIIHARILVRECLNETERNGRQ